MIHRRSFLSGLTAALCAPAIIRTPGLLMPVRRVLTNDDIIQNAYRRLPLAPLTYWWGDADGIKPQGTGYYNLGSPMRIGDTVTIEGDPTPRYIIVACCST